MKCELFSVKSSNSETEIINLKIPELMSALEKKDCSLLYKTEVDYNCGSIETALLNSASSDDSPELIIIANALDTADRSSFLKLFEKAITNFDRESENETIIRTLSGFKSGFSAYYFVYRGIKVIALPQLFACGDDIISMSLSALGKIKRYEDTAALRAAGNHAEKTAPISKNDPLLSDNPIENKKENEEDKNKKTKKKNGFWKTVFPQKGDSAGAVASKILVLVFTVVFFVAAYLLVDDVFIKSLQQGNKINSLMGTIYDGNKVQDMTSPYLDEYDEYDKQSKNWDELFNVNPDIIGLIRIRNTAIDYPVLYSLEMDGSDFYYLYHDYTKTRTKYGSIFLDPQTSSSLNDDSILLHGHHMRDGAMFADLVNYGEYSGNLEAYQNAPVVTLETPEGITKWQIFAVDKLDTNPNDSSYWDYRNIPPSGSADFMEYIYKAKVRSLFNVPIPINENDKLLVLSTCSYEYDDFRTVVFARELRQREGSNYYTNNTTVNNNPLWPDIYYKSTGAYRVSYSDFSTAYKNGELSWYDGNLYQ